MTASAATPEDDGGMFAPPKPESLDIDPETPVARRMRALAEPRLAPTPETEEYGIGSFVYRSRRPFHPARFARTLQHGMPGVIRSKGWFWLANRMDWVGELNSGGAATRTQAAGFWYAARERVRAGQEDTTPLLPPTPLPYSDLGWARQQADCWSAPLPDAQEFPDAAAHAAMARLWHPLWGDRRQEVVFIGMDIEQERLISVLDD